MNKSVKLVKKLFLALTYEKILGNVPDITLEDSHAYGLWILLLLLHEMKRTYVLRTLFSGQK